MIARPSVRLPDFERIERAGQRRATGRLSLVLSLALLCGCHSKVWLAGPRLANPQPRATACLIAADDCGERLALLDAPGLGLPERLALAESYYAAGEFAERQGSCRAVDWFYGTTAICWQLMSQSNVGCEDRASIARANALYRSGLVCLLRSSQRFGRLDPVNGLAIELPSGSLRIPVVVHSPVWMADDVGELVAVGEYRDPALAHYYRRDGQGVPLVAQRRAGRGTALVPAGQPFALTALLRADFAAAAGQPPAVLDFFDPMDGSLAEQNEQLPELATDITAPLAYLHRRASYSPVREFVRPDDSVQLITFGPHQAGKIPIVFVHGLISDPLTYLDLANEIRGDEVLGQRFEIWVFRYPTGGAVLDAAAGLRQQLAAATAGHPDPSLSQMVIIGHSMGGLVAKLQVTESGNQIWGQFARQPFDQLRAPAEIRDRLARAVFFRPSPSISRIVYIATPHQGSPWADRLVGRAASMCVRLPVQAKTGLREVVDNNPDVLLPTAPRRPPTSIDLLEPSSEILQGIRCLQYGPCVTAHTIIGTGRTMICGGPADGVVPVESARDPYAISECEVPATHSAILRAPDTICEVKRILYEHLRQTEPALGQFDEQ